MHVASKVELLHYSNICLEDVEKFYFGWNELSVAINIVGDKNRAAIVTRSGIPQGHTITLSRPTVFESVSAMQFTKPKKNNSHRTQQQWRTVIFLLLPLEHRTSLKRFVSLQFFNLIDNR
jgi:hypothetical protein